MKAGALNRKVSIRKSTASPDTYGGQMTVWSTYLDNRWCQVRPLSMNEQFRAQQIQAEIDCEIVLRYASGVSPGMIAVVDSAEYDIRSVIDVDDRRDELRLLCVRVTT